MEHRSMRAAYFLSRGDHIGRPFEDAIFRGLFQAGFDRIDIFAPVPTSQPDGYSRRFDIHPIEYRLAWLRREILAARWRSYALFLGACDLPMAFAGCLAFRSRKPLVTCCDEIYTGRVPAALGYWGTLARFAMRHSALTVIADRVRCALQRDYAGLPSNHRFVENPCCFASAYDGPSKTEMRKRLNIPADEFVVSFTGEPHDLSGAPEFVRLIEAKLPKVGFLVQTAGLPGRTTDALFRLCASSRPLYYFPERVSYREALQITSAADVGLVIYRQLGPQFRHMGTSSQKLCSHLLLGQPVVALRQASFQFLDDFECGIQVDAEGDIPPALERLRSDYERYSKNARRCVREHLRPAERVLELRDVFRALVDSGKAAYDDQPGRVA